MSEVEILTLEEAEALARAAALVPEAALPGSVAEPEDVPEGGAAFWTGAEALAIPLFRH